ncbi:MULTISPECIES: hypothetical protein [Roseobacteraceae]|jgi:predicted small lipoprotein YifL|nr:hypothetical protein [Roseovarius sp. 10]MDV7201841.1 hypothetical protein [Roseovarius sp. 10]
MGRSFASWIKLGLLALTLGGTLAACGADGPPEPPSENAVTY